MNDRIIKLIKELMSEMEKAGLYKFDGKTSSINIYEIQFENGCRKVSIDIYNGEKVINQTIEFDVAE